MATSMPPPISIEPVIQPEACVILMHGLGTDGHDMEGLVQALEMPESAAIRFVLPHAPLRPVTINGGQEMRAWFDFIPHDEQSGTQDLMTASQAIETIIHEQMHTGIPSEKILLAGFSQGGVLALYTGLRFPHRLAGILSLSAYLHDFTATEAERHDANLALPIMLAHGTMDPMVPVMRGATTRENLIRLGYDVRWFDYPIGHQVCTEELQDIVAFLRATLGGF